MKKFFKKAISFVSALAVSTSVCCATVFAENSNEDFYTGVANLVSETWSDDFVGSIKLKIGSKEMNVDGVTYDVDEGRPTVAEIMNGRTMLPVRAIVEALGGEIGWDENSGEITIEMDGIKIRMKEGSDSLVVNNESIKIDAAPIIKNARTLVPVRALTENLLCNVQWDAENQMVTIVKEFQTKRIIVKGNVTENDYGKFGPTKVLKNGDITVLQFDTMRDAKDCCDAMNALGNVEFAEADGYIPPIGAKSNTTSSSSGFNSWGVDYINADDYAGYVKGVAGNKTVRVAVIDTGVDAGHSYLAGKVDTASGRDFVNGDEDAYDDHGHGTHVAGTIVDCMPGLNVEIVPIKVLSANGGGTSLSVANGIEYAGDLGVDVVNLSLGGFPLDCEYQESAIRGAMNNGTVFAVAAGNESLSVLFGCPAHITDDGVVVVAAHDSDGKAASFSNYGSNVDVAAPGVAIKSTIPSNGYDTWDGTSMATPHVAACLAMIKLANPGITPAEAEFKIEKALSEKCTPYFWGANYGRTLDMTKLMTEDGPRGEVVKLEWSEPSIIIGKGEEYQLKLYATYENGDVEEIIDECTVYSLLEGIATVNSDGVVTGVNTGIAFVGIEPIPGSTFLMPGTVMVIVK